MFLLSCWFHISAIPVTSGELHLIYIGVRKMGRLCKLLVMHHHEAVGKRADLGKVSSVGAVSDL